MNLGTNDPTEVLRRAIATALSGDLASISGLVDSIEALTELKEKDAYQIRAFCGIVLQHDSAIVSDFIKKASRIPPDGSAADVLVFIGMVSVCCPGDLCLLQTCVDVLLDLIATSNLSPALVTECRLLLGDALCFKGAYVDAELQFEKAVALLGVARCKFSQGSVQEARDLVDFLRETQPGVEDQPMFWLLHHKLSPSLDSLDECVRLVNCHIGSVRPLTFSFVRNLNPSLMVELGEALLTAGHVERAKETIASVLKMFPRMDAAVIVIADCHVKNGNFDEAKRVLLESPGVAAAVKLARMYLSEDKVDEAMSSLEFASSLDFSVRQEAIFFIVKAKIFTESENGYLQVLTAGVGCARGSAEDRWTLRQMLIEAYMALNQWEAAEAVIGSSIGFIESKVSLSSATLALARGRIDDALEKLNTIPATSQEHHAVVNIKLEIFSNHRRNRKMFVETLKSIGPDWLLAGDAYLRIGEVDEAMVCYSQVVDGLEKTERLIQANLAAHRYEDAILLLETTPHVWQLVDLLVNLGEFDRAIMAAREWEQKVTVCDSAFEATHEKKWAQLAIDQLEMQTGGKALLLKGSWLERIGEFHSALDAYEAAAGSDIAVRDAALLAMGTLKLSKGDREGGVGDLKNCRLSEAESLLRSVIPVGRGSLLPVLMETMPDGIDEVLMVQGMYRLGRLREVEVDKFGSGGKGMHALCNKDVESLLRLLAKAGGEVDRTLFFLVHLELFRGKPAEAWMGKLSLRWSDEFRFYNSLVAGIAMSQDGSLVAACSQAFVVYRKSPNKAKTALKACLDLVRKSSGYTVLEFLLVEESMCALADIYSKQKRWGKALGVLEFWCAISRGNATAWNQLGSVYHHRGMMKEAVEALEHAVRLGSLDAISELVETYYKARMYFKLVDVVVNSKIPVSSRMRELAEKSIPNLHES